MKKFKFNGRKVAKIATRVVVGAAVTTTIEKAFDLIGEGEELEPAEEIVFHTGTALIGMTVANAVGNETDEIIDWAFDAFEKDKVEDTTNHENIRIIDHEEV